MAGIAPFIGEPDKERLITTLRGGIPDRVPHIEGLIEDQHVTKLLGREAGNTLAANGDPAKGSKEAEGTRPMFAKDYIELCQVIGQDVIMTGSLWPPIRARQPDGTLRILNDRSFKSRADLERVVWPDERDIEDCMQYVREYVQEAQGSRIGVAFAPPCIFQNLYEFVIGLHDCMIMITEEQDLFEELMTRSADYGEELVRRAIEEGVDILICGDDFAYNKGLFVRPEIFRQVWQRHFDRLMAPAREADIPIVFHSDGKIDDAMDMLFEMGVHCITPMDPSGVDYRDYKKRYGHRIALWGNIDITWPLVTGTPADVEKDVADHAEVLKPGGRWLAASAHSIVNYIPHENFVAMIDAFHKYGLY